MGRPEEICTFIATRDINRTNATFVRKVIHMSSHWKKTLPVWYTDWKGIRV